MYYRIALLLLMLVPLAAVGCGSRSGGSATDEIAPAKLEASPTAKVPAAATLSDERISFRASLDKDKVQPGGVVKLSVACTPAPGYHTYPVAQQVPDKPYNTELKFPKDAWYRPLWKAFSEQPSPEVLRVDEGVGERTKIWGYEKEVTWTVDLWVSDKAPKGKDHIEVKLDGQVCNESTCFLFPAPGKLALDIEVAGDPIQPSADITEKLKDKTLEVREVPIDGAAPSPAKAAAPGKVAALASATPDKQAPRALINARTAEAYKQQMDGILDSLKGSAVAESKTDSGTLAFMLGGIFWGFISLITPCVFPMIPITVSYFLKQSEKTHHRPITMASVYCATIVIVMTIAAISLLSFFQWLSQNAYTNLAIGVLFVAFALSLFGMYELELPSSVAQWTSSKEGKGGFAGTIFMALTFTILSFACVAPFLGGFGGTATAGGYTFFDRILGGLAFAITFASPFFVLALFPSLLRKLPRSGTWLNSVKVVMGFLELAAAFKFLRLGELLLRSRGAELFTYDLVLGLWIALAVLCALYLLNLYRLPHDTPLECLGAPRVLLAGVFLCLAFYMLPAMFKSGKEGEQQRPNGSVYAWIDAFLLPDGTRSDLVWSGDLKRVTDEAREQAKATGKPVPILLDITGKSCSNCRYNENSVFPNQRVNPLMQKYKRVQLYTDIVPADFYAFGVDLERQRADGDGTNKGFQQAAFQSSQLPLYGVLTVDGEGHIRKVGVYSEGKINDVSAFTQFLQRNLDTH